MEQTKREKDTRKNLLEKESALYYLLLWQLHFLFAGFHGFYCRYFSPLTLNLALEIPAHVFALVRYITSVINPLLYSLLRPDFYTAMKTLMKRTGRSVMANCGSFHQRREKRQKMDVYHVEHVYCTVSEQLQTLSNEPEQIAEN